MSLTITLSTRVAVGMALRNRVNQCRENKASFDQETAEYWAGEERDALQAHVEIMGYELRY
jgi:hypothetical protein